MQILIKAIRVYLLTLSRVAPKLAGRQAHKLFSTPRFRRPVSAEAQQVMDRAERLAIQTEDGEQVTGYRWRGATSPGAPRVLLAHGWESRASRLAVWIEPLLDAGFEVVAYDGPAHGESGGRQANPLRFVQAIQALVERVGTIDAGIGHSLGGFSLILGVSGAEILERDALELKRLVIVGGANSGVDAMAMFCDVLGLGPKFLPLLLDAAAEEAGQPIAAYDAHRIFPGHPLPTLWMHAPDDDTVPFSAAQKVDQACGHVQLERLDGLGHHKIARDPEVIHRALDFLAPIVDAVPKPIAVGQ